MVKLINHNLTSYSYLHIIYYICLQITFWSFVVLLSLSYRLSAIGCRHMLHIFSINFNWLPINNAADHAYFIRNDRCISIFVQHFQFSPSHSDRQQYLINKIFFGHFQNETDMNALTCAFFIFMLFSNYYWNGVN